MDETEFREKLASLIRAAKANNDTISQNDIDAAFRSADLSDEKKDEISAYFESEGIDVYTEEDSAGDSDDMDDDDDDLESDDDSDREDIDTEKEEVEAKIDYDNLSAEVNIEDPVKLYLKEIGSIPLLTADQEVAIARRIENGRIADNIMKKNSFRTAVPSRRRWSIKASPFQWAMMNSKKHRQMQTLLPCRTRSTARCRRSMKSSSAKT